MEGRPAAINARLRPVLNQHFWIPMVVPESDSRTHVLQAPPDDLHLFPTNRQRFDSFAECVHVNHGALHQGGQEITILFPAGHELAGSQIMDFQAKPGCSSGVGILQSDQALAPTARQDRSFRPNSVGIVTKGVIEGRKFANAPINQVGKVRPLIDKNIGLPGEKQFFRPGSNGRENSLAADDINLIATGDAPGGPKQVFKLMPFHC